MDERDEMWANGDATFFWQKRGFNGRNLMKGAKGKGDGTTSSRAGSQKRPRQWRKTILPPSRQLWWQGQWGKWENNGNGLIPNSGLMWHKQRAQPHTNNRLIWLQRRSPKGAGNTFQGPLGRWARGGSSVSWESSNYGFGRPTGGSNWWHNQKLYVLRGRKRCHGL